MDLSRYINAQKTAYQRALEEIRGGRKRSHWMWYIFPQIDGLGYSPTAQYYAISNLAEAKAYLADPVLGARLVEISEALLSLETGDADLVFGYPDNLKLRSSMTLFHRADPENPVFVNVLDKFFGGDEDEVTLSLLGVR